MSTLSTNLGTPLPFANRRILLWSQHNRDGLVVVWRMHFREAFGLALGDRYRKFYRTLNNAKKPFNSIFNSIFLRIIHSKKLFLKNYSFKEKFIQKNWQLFIQKIIHLEKNGNYSFKKLFNYKKIIQQKIHSKNLKIIHSKKLFIFLKNWLSPRATPPHIHDYVIYEQPLIT